MRIILKNSFFSVVCFLTVLFFGVMSCQRENGPVGKESGSPIALDSGEAALSFRVSTPVVGDDTKSVITDTYFETGIRSILILVLGEDGSWKSTYKEASSGYLSTGTGVAALDLDAVRVRACYQDYTVYAFVNMGDVMDNMPVDASGKPTPDAYVYSMPVAYPDLGTRGMPMCAKVTVDTDDLPAGGQANVVLTLRRLMAKVVISVNKTGMTGENAGVLNSSIIRVRQVPRVIRPFAAGGSGALEVVELYGGVGASSTDTDYYYFSAGAAAGAAYHTNVTTLYVPENYQGVGSETSQEKKATAPGETPTGRQALATFLEYKASKSGTNDGVSGNLTYKAYLGENVVNDYNVIGDKVYRATLNLSWNGLFFDGDWRVDNSDITDGRILTLSETPHTTSSSFTDWGRLRRNVASQLYINFSRDGGSTWVHSAKDIGGWPYGWDLYIDGVKQATGASATAAGDLGWSYVGDPSRDQLFITPGPSSVTLSTHTLQVKSADGRVASNVVSFIISSPLTLAWDTTAPVYVAQRGRVHPTNLEDPSAEVVYTIISGNTKVRLNSASDAQSTMVGFLAPGTATVRGECAATGQSGDFEVTVTSPVLRGFGSWPTRLYANPDGSPAHSEADGLQGLIPEAGYYTKASGGSRLVRQDLSTTALAVNTALAGDLYDEVLALTPSVTGALLGASSDGLNVEVYADKLTSGATSYPDNVVVELGTLTVTAKSAAAGVGSLSTNISSVRPFTAYDTYRNTVVTLDTSRDIHDFTVLDPVDANPLISSSGLSETTYSIDVPNIVCTPGYASVEATYGLDFGGTYNSSTKKYSWNSVIKDNATRRSQDTAGIFELAGYVRNCHSNEKLYTPTFYRGRLFRHGAVVAYGFIQNATQQTTMGVSCRYLGSYWSYTSAGLRCAFPNIISTRTNHEYNVLWSRPSDPNYMGGNQGNTRLVRRSSDMVTAVNSSNVGSGQLFTVEDLCGRGTLGQWMEIPAEYDSGVLDFRCHGTATGVTHDGSFDASGGSPEMRFETTDGSVKYNKIRVVNNSLVFLKPATDSPTHDYAGQICGFFVLHLVNEIRDNRF